MKVFTLIFILILLSFPSAFAGESDDDIVVIIGKGPKEAITVKTLERIYLKRKTVWDNGQPIVPLNLSPKDRLRVIFTRKILVKNHRQLVEHWNEKYFSGITPPLVLESEEAVKKFVRKVDGAIGYIRRKNADADLFIAHTIRSAR